jgi:DNA-binding NarL/FixJ family response regulator
MSIKVMIAFNNMLFAKGVCNILESFDDMKIVDVLNAGTKCSQERLESLDPDVVLVDFTTLYNAFPEADTTRTGFVLLDTDCGTDIIVSAILTKKLSGVLLCDATPALLEKAVRAVAKGEVWIDKTTVKNLLYGINAIKKTRTAELSNREKEIVTLIGEGYRNKEIASKLCISEPTVKSHLQHIFRKLDIKNRSQLITFAIKNYELTNFFKDRVDD